MKIVIQKAIIKVIQPAKYKYVCDGCGYEFEKGEKKNTWYCAGKTEHYCKNCKPK